MKFTHHLFLDLQEYILRHGLGWGEKQRHGLALSNDNGNQQQGNHNGSNYGNNHTSNTTLLQRSPCTDVSMWPTAH